MRAPVVLSFLCVVPIVAASAHAAGAGTPPAPPAAPTALSAAPPATTTVPVLPHVPPPAGRGFAVELSTGGFSGGALGLGWGVGSFAAGVALDFRHSSLSGPDVGSSTPELTESAIAFGPWMRWDMARALDGRASLFGALDVQYSSQSVATKTDASPTRAEASASGLTFRLGPGVRFWATPWVAIGYTTQLAIGNLSGPLLAFTQGTTLAPSTYEFDQFRVELVGRFSVLALF